MSVHFSRDGLSTHWRGRRSYGVDDIDSVSSTRNDTGSVVLTTSGSLAGVTDTYTWDDVHIVTDGVDDTSVALGTSITQGGSSIQDFQIVDTGTESITLTGASSTFSIAASWSGPPR